MKTSLLPALLLLLPTGCLSPSVDETGKRCRGSEQACAEGYTCLVGRCVAGAAPQNLLVNGDFEDARPGNGWNTSEKLAPAPERTTVQHGAQALRLSISESTSDPGSISPNTPPVKDGAGKLFCLCGYAAAPGLTAGFTVSFVEGSLDGGSSTVTRTVSAALTDELQPFSTSRVARAGGSLSLQVGFTGKRTAGDGLLVDDFSLWESLDGGCP